MLKFEAWLDRTSLPIPETEVGSEILYIYLRVELFNSSSTLSLLPASPKIFCGREAEMGHITSCLTRAPTVNIAILGPGGIGKSCLALAVIHHPEIISKFGTSRYFVSCDAANSAMELISTIAAYFNLGQRGNPTNAIVRCLKSIGSPILLVLDNLETAWEPPETRTQVEDFLSLLCDVDRLSMIVRI